MNLIWSWRLGKCSCSLMRCSARHTFASTCFLLMVWLIGELGVLVLSETDWLKRSQHSTHTFRDTHACIPGLSALRNAPFCPQGVPCQKPQKTIQYNHDQTWSLQVNVSLFLYSSPFHCSLSHILLLAFFLSSATNSVPKHYNTSTPIKAQTSPFALLDS